MITTIRHYPKRKSIAYGDCPYNQTLCNRIEEDAINGCPLCEPYAKGKSQPHYPMPAIYTAVRFCLDGIEIKDTEMAKQGEYLFFAYR